MIHGEVTIFTAVHTEQNFGQDIRGRQYPGNSATRYQQFAWPRHTNRRMCKPTGDTRVSTIRVYIYI
jgi:hypothetical protein